MTKYIAIEGRGGSGKTYLSEALGKKLGATVFHLDKYGSDFVPFIGIPALAKAVQAAPSNIVVYEGVGVFNRRLDKFKPVRIFVDTPPRVREERLAQRDIPRKDRTEWDWRVIGRIWHKAEKVYFATKRSHRADLVVGSQDGQFDVAVIAREVTALLAKKSS